MRLHESLHRRPRGGSATLAILVAVAFGLGLAGELPAQIIINVPPLRIMAGPGPAYPPEPKDDQQVLSGAGINADAQSIGAYLRKLKLSPASADDIQKLVAQLGSEVWKEREEASARLTALGPAAAEALAAAAKSPDAEVRARAEKILSESSRANVMESALAVAAEKKMALPIVDLLGVEGLCQEGRPRRLLERLLEASATPKDLPAIRAAIKSSSNDLKPCLLGALAKSAGDQAGQELLAAGAEQEKVLGLPVAYALIDRDDPRCLTLLTQLLKGQDSGQRRQAAVLLQDLAGKDFGLLKDSSPDDEQKRALAWAEGEGKTAKLLFEQAHPKQWGRTLVCLAETNELAEFDEEGKKTWSVKMDDPWACQGLPNGHRLGGSVKGRKAIEFDEDGKEVWKVEDLPGACNCLLRLRNGNTLVGCREAKKFIEFNPQGKTVREIPLPGEPFLIQRLDNGLLLVLLKDTETIVEMDQTGKIGWKLGPLEDVMGLQRLPNGNTLVALSETAKIVEYDRSGKAVWEYNDLSPDMSVRGPKGIQRLDDGTTLIGDMFSLNRVDKNGKLLQRINCGYVVGVHRY